MRDIILSFSENGQMELTELIEGGIKIGLCNIKKKI